MLSPTELFFQFQTFLGAFLDYSFPMPDDIKHNQKESGHHKGAGLDNRNLISKNTSILSGDILYNFHYTQYRQGFVDIGRSEKKLVWFYRAESN